MIRIRWRFDTLAAWLMKNILAAIMLVVALNMAVILSTSVWARPSLNQGGLLEQMGVALRAIEATPVAGRARLAAAISTRTEYRLNWYPTRTAVPMPPMTKHPDDESYKSPIFDALGRRQLEVFDPHHDDPKIRSGQTHYVMAAQLDDGSWIAFDTPTRIWGVYPETRFLVIGLFVLVSSLTVAAIASRRLSRPMRRLADAAERFGADVHAPAIHPEGPRELQVAVRAFNDMQQRIQRFVRDRTEMLAAISHDMRSPLTRIRLRGEYIDDVDQQRKLFADVDEMRAMVDAALAFFSDEAQEETSTRFDLAGLVNTVIDDARDEGGVVTYAGPQRQIYDGRPKALKRAIANLVANGVRYGGDVTVTLEVTAHAIGVHVADHGPGIPEALLQTVFRPFFRAEQSRNRHTGGVGLGLPTARGIARGHGGDIHLRNIEGGLEALLMLPVTAATSQR